MCKFKSGIILKDKIFIPDYDGHTDMLDELDIADNRSNAEKLFVRAELIPVDDNVFAPIETWHFNVDQDIIPEWFVMEHERERMIAAVKEWSKNHIRIDESDFIIAQGVYYLKNCKRVTCNNSTVEAYGNSTVEAWGNSTVEAWGNSTVEAYDNSTVKAWGNSIACLPTHSSNNRDNIVLMENSTLKDRRTKTIYQSGDWKLVLIDG